MRLQGRAVVVTGASRGMGLAIARRFAAEGARVAMLARKADELEAAAAGVADALPVVCDVSDPKSVQAAFAQIETELGGVDVLVNNAALATPQLLEEADDAASGLEVAVNLLGPLYCMRHAVASMRRRGGGDIINVSSESVATHYPYLGLYAATKSALETLSAAARYELSVHNIRVTVYRSGRVQSTFHHHWDAEMLARVRAAAEATGFVAQSGASISPEIPAQAMVDLVLLDRSARIDFLQLRGA